MSHQPLPIPVNEESSSTFVEGGTLANNILDKFLSQSPTQSLSIDNMIDLPFLHDSFTISSADTNNELVYVAHDPIAYPYKADASFTTNTNVPFALVALKSAYFYDFDITITFQCIKHTRARGQYRIFWVPGMVNATPTTAFDMNLIESNIDITRVHSWNWDLEKDETITVTLKGIKNSSWRTRQTGGLINNTAPEALKSYTIFGGQLFVTSVLPYDGSQVSANSATVLMWGQLTNLRLDQYRCPAFYARTEVGWEPVPAN